MIWSLPKELYCWDSPSFSIVGWSYHLNVKMALPSRSVVVVMVSSWRTSWTDTSATSSPVVALFTTTIALGITNPDPDPDPGSGKRHVGLFSVWYARMPKNTGEIPVERSDKKVWDLIDIWQFSIAPFGCSGCITHAEQFRKSFFFWKYRSQVAKLEILSEGENGPGFFVTRSRRSKNCVF